MIFFLKLLASNIDYHTNKCVVRPLQDIKHVKGRGPMVVVRGSFPGLGGLKETKMFSSPSTCEAQYCGEPP